MEYEDFELEIGLGRGREYPLTVVQSPAGETHATMIFPYDELALKEHLLNLERALLHSGESRRRIQSPEQQAVQDFGQGLCDALLVGEVRSCFEISRSRASGQGKGLRLKLRIQAPELAGLPWEFLYDRRENTFLALSAQTPIVRYLTLPRAVEPLAVGMPLRLLGMVASPQGMQALDTRRERRRLEEALAGLVNEGIVEVTWVEGETWRDLQRVLRAGPWHILHFIGHGGFDPVTDEGTVLLCNEAGDPHMLTANQFAELVVSLHAPRLVVLNSCEGGKGGKQDVFSSTASALVRRGIPAVVAMQYEITDRAAIEFSRSFYEAVAESFPIEVAMAEARRAIYLTMSNSVEWGIPTLFSHAPNGVLFEVKRTGRIGGRDEKGRTKKETRPTDKLERGMVRAEEPEKAAPEVKTSSQTSDKSQTGDVRIPSLASAEKGQPKLSPQPTRWAEPDLSIPAVRRAEREVEVKRGGKLIWQGIGWIALNFTVIPACAIAWRIVMILVAFAVVSDDFSIFAICAAGAVPAGGIMAGGQWLFLRRPISLSKRWIWVTMVGLAIGWLGGVFIWVPPGSVLTNFGVIFQILMVGLVGAGFCQWWFVLRGTEPRAWRWAGVSSIGWLVVAVMGLPDSDLALGILTGCLLVYGILTWLFLRSRMQEQEKVE